MSSSAATAAVVAGDHSFFWRRLHSLTGIFPVGFFLIEHLFSNAFALRGAEAYNAQVKFLVSMPLVVGMEILFIYLPILYHGLYGVYIWWRGDSNVLAYSWLGNWLYTAQRLTGLVSLAFILFHVWEQRFSGAHLLEHPEQAFGKVQQSLANPLVLWFYVVGIVCACFHFAYGLWLFGCKWGITPGPRAQRLAGYLCGGFGAALTGLGLVSLRAFVR